MTSKHSLQSMLRKNIINNMKPEGTVKNTLRAFAEYVAVRRIRKLNVPIKKAEYQKKIIFNCLYTRFSVPFYHELAIAKALQLSGHDVVFLICNKGMYHCTPVFSVNKESNKICDNCSNFGRAILRASNLPYRELDSYKYSSNFLSRFINNNDFDKSIFNSIERYYKGIFHRNNAEVRCLHEDKYYNASFSHSIAETIYRDEKPDIIFSTHYTYAEWNPFYEYMKSKGVKYVTWDYSYSQNKMIFDLEDLGLRFDKYYTFSDENLKEVDNYIAMRKSGKEDTAHYNFNPEKKVSVDNKYKKIFAIFPNLSWDTSLTNSNKVFSSVHEWVDKTVEFFKEHQEYFLFIKIHPAEKVEGSLNTMADYVKARHTLTNNIKIIDNDSGISPYSLYDAIDVGLVYNGTVGIELSTFGKPVIVAGNIFYVGKGFTYDVTDIEDYFKKIETVKGPISIDMILKAKKFAYFYMIESSIPLNFVYNSILGSKFTLKSFNDLLNDKGMNQVLSYILDGDKNEK